MEPAATPGAATFRTTGAAYDAFMGRYSKALAGVFVDTLDVRPPQRALDVGCGPGALTTALVERLGPDAVSACDPSPPFVAACAAAFDGVDVRAARAESLPFGDEAFDEVAAQLVLHFVSEPEVAAAEMGRVARPGAVIAANMWDFADGMEMLRCFWDAALAIDADAPDEARVLRFGGAGEMVELFASAGLEECVETTLVVSSEYVDFDELWSGFLFGIGPAGSYCVGLTDTHRVALRNELFARVGEPTGRFALAACARCAVARKA